MFPNRDPKKIRPLEEEMADVGLNPERTISAMERGFGMLVQGSLPPDASGLKAEEGKAVKRSIHQVGQELREEMALATEDTDEPAPVEEPSAVEQVVTSVLEGEDAPEGIYVSEEELEEAFKVIRKMIKTAGEKMQAKRAYRKVRSKARKYAKQYYKRFKRKISKGRKRLRKRFGGEAGLKKARAGGKKRISSKMSGLDIISNLREELEQAETGMDEAATPPRNVWQALSSLYVSTKGGGSMAIGRLMPQKLVDELVKRKMARYVGKNKSRVAITFEGELAHEDMVRERSEHIDDLPVTPYEESAIKAGLLLMYLGECFEEVDIDSAAAMFDLSDGAADLAEELMGVEVVDEETEQRLESLFLATARCMKAHYEVGAPMAMDVIEAVEVVGDFIAENDFGDDDVITEADESRFEKLSGELRAKGAKDPDALAAWIGRKKYGKEKFAKMAARGHGEDVDDVVSDGGEE